MHSKNNEASGWCTGSRRVKKEGCGFYSEYDKQVNGILGCQGGYFGVPYLHKLLPNKHSFLHLILFVTLYIFKEGPSELCMFQSPGQSLFHLHHHCLFTCLHLLLDSRFLQAKDHIMFTFVFVTPA